MIIVKEIKIHYFIKTFYKSKKMLNCPVKTNKVIDLNNGFLHITESVHFLI